MDAEMPNKSCYALIEINIEVNYATRTPYYIIISNLSIKLFYPCYKMPSKGFAYSQQSARCIIGHFMQLNTFV